MKSMIAPSMMCADILHLEQEVKALESAGIDYFHMDIMDGTFVPNMTLSPYILDAMRTVTDIPFDIHLMVNKPEEKLDWFDIRENDIVSIHAETTAHTHRVIERIKDKGAKAGIAVNPATPKESLFALMDDVDVFLIMTVNPGFAGQKMVESALKKIAAVKLFIEAEHKEIAIEVDGNVSFKNAGKMRDAGADIFIAGTSSVFDRNMTYTEAVAKLREAIR